VQLLSGRTLIGLMTGWLDVVLAAEPEADHLYIYGSDYKFVLILI